MGKRLLVMLALNGSAAEMDAAAAHVEHGMNCHGPWGGTPTAMKPNGHGDMECAVCDALHTRAMVK